MRPDRRRVQDYADSVNLVTYKQMQELFPGCTIERERFMGLTKSLIAVSGPRPTGARVQVQGDRAGAPAQRS